MVTCSLDTLKESSKKKETRIKKKIVKVLQQASYRKKRTAIRNCNDEVLGFDLVFVGYNKTDFNFIFCYYWLFSKSQFSGI